MKRAFLTLVPATVAVTVMAIAMAKPAIALAGSGTRLVETARTFLESLESGVRDDISWPFDDPERTDVHYAPFGLDGVRHDELNREQQEFADALLAQVMSPRGVRKVTEIRLLERDVAAEESAIGRLFGFRDPGRYFWAFFGEPVESNPWGFRFEGHHLSLNVTVAPDAPSVTTPLFLGAQPRVVPSGFPSSGVAALGEEERLARTLYASLNDTQRAEATLPYRSDRGHMLGQVSRIDSPEPIGLPRREMSREQQVLLDEFLELFAGLWNKETAAARRAEINAARDGLHFAFVERDAPPNAFYVRVSGPGLLIEIDNTEGGDHVHAVWHNPASDFGDDLLARHYQQHHSQQHHSQQHHVSYPATHSGHTISSSGTPITTTSISSGNPTRQ